MSPVLGALSLNALGGAGSSHLVVHDPLCRYPFAILCAGVWVFVALAHLLECEVLKAGLADSSLGFPSGLIPGEVSVRLRYNRGSQGHLPLLGGLEHLFLWLSSFYELLIHSVYPSKKLGYLSF